MQMKRWQIAVLVSSVAGAVVGCQVSAEDPDGDAGQAGEAGSAGTGGTTSSGGASGGGAGGGSGGTGGTAGSAPDEVNEILNDPAVHSALEEARDQGVDIPTHTEKDAPDPSGYYWFAPRAGTWVASGNGANVGFTTHALEMRVALNSDGTVDTASVNSPDGFTPANSAVNEGYLLRGAGDEVTLYGNRTIECNLDGSSYTIVQAYIWTGTFDGGTGDWLDQRQFVATTSTEGELTAACEEGLVGNTEVVGGWAVVTIPEATKITVDDLVLMCVDGDAGYVASESWVGEGGTACECTPEYVIACE
jgi:hypothetical protein